MTNYMIIIFNSQLHFLAYLGIEMMSIFKSLMDYVHVLARDCLYK